MNVLVIGGTRFFGIYTVEALLKQGHTVTIASRGKHPDPFGKAVSRIALDRSDRSSIEKALSGKYFDIVIDKLAYSSNDIRSMLDVIHCGKYIHMSSTAVYDPKHMNLKEADFDAAGGNLVWCSRMDFPYDEAKRQAEYALAQCYSDQKSVAVRYPFVIGKDDYTNRLAFYVNHVCQGKAMYIDNIDHQMSFIRSDEAGDFMAFLTDCTYEGAINGASYGTISIGEVLNYIEKKTGKCTLLSDEGDAAPYNGEPAYSINTDKALELGYRFSNLKDWIFALLDHYIALAAN